MEEPIRPEYIPAWGRLRAQFDVPLAARESPFLPQDFLASLTVGVGVEIGESALATDDHVRWVGVLTIRPNGSPATSDAHQ